MSGLLAHFDVAHNGAHRIERQRHGIGRDRIDAQSAAFFNHIGQAQMQFGKYAFGRQKHQRRIGRLAGDNIFFGNILRMFQRVAFHLCQCGACIGIIFGGAQFLIGLERNLLSITTGPGGLGNRMRQSARLPFDNVC